MKIMKVNYGSTDGVSISALYLRETTTTEKSGELLGGGLSSSGVVVGGGGYAGSETNRTLRSATFAPPREKTVEPDTSRMLELLSYLGVGIVGFTILTYGIYGILTLLTFPFSTIMKQLFDDAIYFYIFLGVISGLFIIVTTPKDYTKVDKEKMRNGERMEVYHRLRYVEVDNIVFDPATLKGCHADRDYISSLIENIIR